MRCGAAPSTNERDGDDCKSDARVRRMAGDGLCGRKTTRRRHVGACGKGEGRVWGGGVAVDWSSVALNTLLVAVPLIFMALAMAGTLLIGLSLALRLAA